MTRVGPRWLPISLVLAVSLTVAEDGAVPDPTGCCVLLDFEDTTPGECVNEKYADLGIHIFRDFGGCVLAVDWSATGHRTPSPPMAIGSFAGPGSPGAYNAINVELDQLANTVLACIGNDPEVFPLYFEASGPLHSATSRTRTNGNHDIDQLRGVSLVSGRGFDFARWVHLDPQYVMAIDRLFVSFCPHNRLCPIDPGLSTEDGHPDLCETIETY